MWRTEPKRQRGDVMLDDDFCRLYIVLESFLDENKDVAYRCIIVCDWSMTEHRPNYPGQRVTFGNGVELDKVVGRVELPPTL